MDPSGTATWNRSHVQEQSEHFIKESEEECKLGDEKLVIRMICHDSCVQRWKMLNALGK